ncbi:MAG TPA: hypothetical protein VFV37_08990 [Luteibaculaceae bacterium]|nr:hypothetical protein [Luteibaculaceae bacterium]
MIWRISIVFFTASVKFLFAPLTARGLGFDWLTCSLAVATGGTTGVMFFYFLSARILQRQLLRKARKALEPGYRKPKIFTRTNKAIVRIKQRFGLLGMAFLTLPFISIPVCTIITTKFFRHKPETLPMLVVSVLVWTAILTGSVYFF